MSGDPAAFLEQLRVRLGDSVPGLIVWQEPEGRATRLIFPARPGSDYRFVALVRDRLDRVVLEAELVRDAELRFWRHAVERGQGGEEALAERAATLLARLLSGRSRIRQRRGTLTWSFICELPDDGGELLAGAKRLRWLGKAPPVGEAEAVYQAGPAKTRVQRERG